MTQAEQVGAADRQAERAIAQMVMLMQHGMNTVLAGDSSGSKGIACPTLGIVGFGKAGMEVARRAHFGFGMDIVVYDRRTVTEDELKRCGARQAETLDGLLAVSDVVSLHCPGTPGNRHLIDAFRLNAMKPGAYLINTSHGELIDMLALTHALWFETIAGARINVPDEATAAEDSTKRAASMQRCAA